VCECFGQSSGLTTYSGAILTRSRLRDLLVRVSLFLVTQQLALTPQQMKSLHGEQNSDSHCDDVLNRSLGLLMNNWYHRKTIEMSQSSAMATKLRPKSPAEAQSSHIKAGLGTISSWGTGSCQLQNSRRQNIFINGTFNAN
jgi:hypothetical protein